MSMAIFSLIHGENKLHFAKMIMMSYLYQKTMTQFDFYKTSPMKQQSARGHVAPLCVTGAQTHDLPQSRQARYLLQSGCQLIDLI